ncbi:unnamed protein product, partial [Prorocentrum cordatum]
ASGEWLSSEKWAATFEGDRKWRLSFYEVCRRTRPLSIFVPGVILVKELIADVNTFDGAAATMATRAAARAAVDEAAAAAGEAATATTPLVAVLAAEGEAAREAAVGQFDAEAAAGVLLDQGSEREAGSERDEADAGEDSEFGEAHEFDED